MRRFSHLLAPLGLLGTLVLTGATVSYSEESLPSSMNPLFARTMVDNRTMELVFDRLYYRSALDNTLKSRIVERHEKVGDGTKIKLFLKQGIKWHDGEALTSDDICFTIQAMLDPKTPSAIAKTYRERITSCESLPKESAAVVTFNKVYHEPREHLGFSILPKHSFPGGTTISPDLEFSSRPIGSGPMKGSKGRREVRFDVFPNLHHAAKIDVLSMIEGGDPLLQVRSIINGDTQGVISVAPPQRPDVAAQDDVALKSYDLRSWWFIALNTNKGPLKDKKVRQALNLSLDRSELRELTIGVDPADENPPCEFVSGPFVQVSPYYNRQVKVIEKSDRAKAKELLKSAGATEAAGRWLWSGAPLNLKIGMNAPLDGEATDLLNQVGNQFQAGGFDRTVYRITADDWGRKAVTGDMADFDMLIGKWSFGNVEDVNPLFHTRANGKGLWNIFNYSNPQVDAILGKFDAAKTDTEAKDAYHELHAYLADDLPYLFLWKLDTKSAWRNEIRNGTITPYFYFTEFDGWKYEGK